MTFETEFGLRGDDFTAVYNDDLEWQLFHDDGRPATEVEKSLTQSERWYVERMVADAAEYEKAEAFFG